MSVLDIDPEQLAFIRLPTKCIAMVVAALRAGGCAKDEIFGGAGGVTKSTPGLGAKPGVDFMENKK